MKIVGSDDTFIFIAGDGPLPSGCGKRAVFLSEKAFSAVKAFVEATGTKPDEDYWEENHHDQIAERLAGLTKFPRDDISNSLCALGL